MESNKIESTHICLMQMIACPASEDEAEPRDAETPKFRKGHEKGGCVGSYKMKSDHLYGYRPTILADYMRRLLTKISFFVNAVRFPR